ncbi:MAG: rhodanese-like domain-containing protein [Candidatus Thiodiazotropha sp. L084R]
MTLIKSMGFIATLLSVSITSDILADGNRYFRDRLYHSEISAAQANQELKSRGHFYGRHGHRGARALLVDVRSMEEFAAGHPNRSNNIPYPRVCLSCEAQSEATFYWEVYNLAQGDTSRLIMTLCRTGSRSISAANVLANPSEYGIDGPAFTNVRNIWEGFVGQYKYAYDGGTILLDSTGTPVSLDLNNNGEMDSDSADVYLERNDSNPDKDGWRNFQQLPWSTKVTYRNAYLNDPDQYELLTLTPVE